MKLGDWVKLVERYHRIKDHSVNNQKRIEGYDRMLSDIEQAFEELEQYPKIQSIYDAIQYEKEVLENALVRS